MFFGELLGGSIYFLLYRKHFDSIKKNISREVVSLNNKEFALKTVYLSNTKSKLILLSFLLLIAFFDAFSISGTLYVAAFLGDITQTNLAFKCLQIISTGLLCYLILHFGLYRHQYLAISLISIGIILITWNHFQKEIQSLYHILILIGLIILSSLHETTIRYVMDEKKLHPIKLLFYEGLIGTIFIGLILFILSFIYCPISLVNYICLLNGTMDNLYILFQHFNWFIGVFLFVWVICSSGFNFFARLLIFYLTPTHRSIAEMLSSFAFWIYMQVIDTQNEDSIEFASTIIGYIILVFGYLIYNEIVTIRLCELDYYTKKGITGRSIGENSILHNLELAINDVKLEEVDENI